jgi:hypothetical protein
VAVEKVPGAHAAHAGEVDPDPVSKVPGPHDPHAVADSFTE